MRKRQKNRGFFSYNFPLRNRKGTEKITSVYWFAILFIVAAAIVYMVSAFYGKPYDVRDVEARLLSDKVADCLSPAGYLREDAQSLNADNFLEKCNLNFNVEDSYGWDADQYYIAIIVSDLNSGQILKEADVGNRNLADSCELNGKKFPACFEREAYSLDKFNDNSYKIKILSAIRKTEKNVE